MDHRPSDHRTMTVLPGISRDDDPRRPAPRGASFAGAALALLLAAFAAALVVTAPAADATTCPTAGLTFNGQVYCPGTISGVKSTSYGVGTRVVLQGVSVTGRTTRTVTLEALESTPCPPGYFCGATLTTTSLTVAWKGQARPGVGTVVDLYGITTTGSLTPVGYAPNTSVCYIDYC